MIRGTPDLVERASRHIGTDLAQPAGESPPDLAGFDELFVSSLSFSEMSMGLYTVSGREREARRDLLDDLMRIFGPGIPYDDAAAIIYGRVVRQAVDQVGSAKNHELDRMIAAAAVANRLTLVTRNGADLNGLGDRVAYTER